MNSDQVKYYSLRAGEYEKIYDKPERKNDLAFISEYLKNHFRDKQVLEIACGTGYWTRIISETAESIFASDINPAVLEIAGAKQYECPVEFNVDDLFNLPGDEGTFDAGFAGFIWSHIPRNELLQFIDNFLVKIKSGGIAIFIDNEYVEGNSTPIAFTDENGNTCQIRKLEDGSEYKVIKNYPSDDELTRSLEPYSSNIEIKRLEFFWILKINLS
jgi:demethylmenaquinone methyltransferase/2-methoxy-6-polyprenyl-1,4-benzoquinol methylase